MNVEKIILKNLIKNEPYTRKSLPFLKDEYFLATEDKELFSIIREFILKYNALPSNDALGAELQAKKGLNEETLKAMVDTLNEINKNPDEPNIDWLIETTETFCQDKAIYNAITKSIEIINSKGNLSKGAIPDLLSDALAVSFDPNVGHDYLEQYKDRFEYYHRVQDRIPFDLEYFNKVTGGGLPKKTLNIILAGTGVGKSLFMCHCAAAALTLGKKVLYITLELSQEEVGKRIDANLMNTPFKDLMVMPEDIYLKRGQALKAKTNGKLIIKEYPTASASTLQFKALLRELELKKKFIPDVIFIDYLNICTSARIKPGGNVNSYTYVKAIAEELRGLAVEYELPVVSATQTNRTGFVSTDLGLEDTSESFGLPATADFMFALMRSETLDQLGQIEVKQLKNRFEDPSTNKKFVIGVDITKMKLYDVEASAQKGISDSGQVEQKPPEQRRNKFDKLKVQ
jgi:replicative DNA helicase